MLSSAAANAGHLPSTPIPLCLPTPGDDQHGEGYGQGATGRPVHDCPRQGEGKAESSGEGGHRR